MIYGLNFASDNFHNAQVLNSISAKLVGGFDKYFQFSPKDIDQVFFNKNKSILEQKKGAGYWLWKPYFVKKVLETVNNGDYVFYCDSGVIFVSSIRPLVQVLEKSGGWLIPFDVGLIEKKYTKQDAFIMMDCDSDYYKNSSQILGGYFLFKKCNASLDFVNKWIDYAQDPRILTDIENTNGLRNDESFIAHRHDQSIFSLLCKKNNIIPLPDPAIFKAYEKVRNISSRNFLYLHRNKRKNIKDGSIIIEPFRLFIIVNVKKLINKKNSL